MSTVASDTQAGTAVYTPLVLGYIYNFWVLAVSNTFAWRCPTAKVLVPFFNRLISKNHVDIGTGTGYYLARAPLLSDASVTLVDLSPHSLDASAAALRRAHPSVQARAVRADVLSARPLDLPDGGVDSISVMYLLHCLPGPPAQKGALLSRLRHFLTRDGVLFGATILGDTAPHNLFGRILMSIYNRNRTFGNVADTPDDFLKPLQEAFDHVSYRIEGVVLLFEAKGPRV